MTQGYIKLYRKIQDNELWKAEKFDKARAWIDMILLANHTDNMFFVRGVEVHIKRGQLAWSEANLAKKWGWSRDKVRRFFTWLKTRQQIRQQKSYIISIVTIVNYEDYQENKTTDKTTEKQQTRQQKNTNNNVKNIKNEKNVEENKNTTLKKIDFPDFISKELFQHFRDMRKKIRRPMTYKAEELIIQKLIKFKNKGHDPNEILKASIQNSWQGVFEPRITNYKAGITEWLNDAGNSNNP